MIFYEELVPDLCLTLASILDAHECVVQMLDEYPLNVTVSLQNIQVVKASFFIIILYLFIYLNFQIYVCHNSLGYLRSDWFGWVKVQYVETGHQSKLRRSKQEAGSISLAWLLNASWWL